MIAGPACLSRAKTSRGSIFQRPTDKSISAAVKALIWVSGGPREWRR